VDGQRCTPVALPLRKRPGTKFIRDWVGPRAGLDGCERSRPQQDWTYDVCTFMLISRWIILRMRHVLDESCRENQYLVFNNLFPENRDIYEIIWKNMVQPGRPQMTIWRMRFASRIPKATDTHSDYVILIASPPNSGCRNLPHTSRKLVYFAVRNEYLNIGLIWDSFSRGHPIVLEIH
jgi:hypothetical protein